MTDTPIISVNDVFYRYEDEGQDAVDNVSLTAQKGAFVAVLGHNGSGKSTFAKLLNALFLPTRGTIAILSMDTRDEKLLWDIRQNAGMIFQNPDNQIVATVVKEDVAFGLENMGVPRDEMVVRIDEALQAVRMKDFEESAPHMLSGGQKQRVAIAGVLAMKPCIIIADEATAMLDPTGREEVFETVKKLNRENGITVLWITHFMEEAALSDRVVIMSKGRIVLDGKPKDVFSQVEELRALNLDVPPMAELSRRLSAKGVDLPKGILTVDEMAREVEKRLCPSK